MTAFDREIPTTYFAFDALRSFDLPQLLASSRAVGVVVNPLDGDWGRLSEAAARRLLPPRVGVISDDAPDAKVGEFLRAAIGQADE
jgi:hypothetical protein